MKCSIFASTSQGYSATLLERVGRGYEIARSLYRGWYREGRLVRERAEFRNAGVLIEEIIAQSDFSLPEVVAVHEEGATQKALVRLSDGAEVEMVLIPMGGASGARKRTTLCISSQVGCRMGCLFCRTAKMGLVRHLEIHEIVAQVFIAKHLLGVPIANIVFMGMGEPFDNYENVMGALRVLTDPLGFGFGPSRITVSTSGLADKIRQFAIDADPAINLAVSLSAGSDAARARLMPVNREHGMGELREAMVFYTQHPRRRIFIEYVMIRDRNESLEEAARLADYLQGLPVTINLIPYNPIGIVRLQSADSDAIDAFAGALRARGFRVTVRARHGQGIMAACGQLASKRKRL